MFINCIQPLLVIYRIKIFNIILVIEMSIFIKYYYKNKFNILKFIKYCFQFI